jgi:hypothetical protein
VGTAETVDEPPESKPRIIDWLPGKATSEEKKEEAAVWIVAAASLEGPPKDAPSSSVEVAIERSLLGSGKPLFLNWYVKRAKPKPGLVWAGAYEVKHRELNVDADAETEAVFWRDSAWVDVALLLIADRDGSLLAGPEPWASDDMAERIKAVEVVGPAGFEPPARFLRVKWSHYDISGGETLFHVTGGKARVVASFITDRGGTEFACEATAIYPSDYKGKRNTIRLKVDEGSPESDCGDEFVWDGTTFKR